MKKIMLIGRTGSGKTTLTQVLKNQDIDYKKTQDIDYSNKIIDTPGEYIEIKGYYRALIVNASECDIIGFVQDARDEQSIFPPHFAETLNKPVVGIITKIDLVENTKRAEDILFEIGVRDIVKISSFTQEGINNLKKIIGDEE